MVRVALTRGSNGVLVRVKASGHSTAGPRGQNLVCGAATVLLRTAARTFESEPAITVGGSAADEGELELTLERVPDALVGWARGVSENLVRGLTDLSEEFPNEIHIELNYR